MTILQIQTALWAVGLSLQFLLLSALLGGAWREFPAVFVYAGCLALTTGADIYSQLQLGKGTYTYHLCYWTGELIRQTALLAVVVSLAVDVVPPGRSRNMAVRGIIAAAAIFWAGSLMIHHQPVLDDWMTKVSRNLSFCSAIVNLGVWFAIISTERRDMRRLMLAGGLGLQMTGEAIGHSLRYLFYTRNPALASGLLIVFSHFLCLLIWWQAVGRPAAASSQVRSTHA